MLNIEDKVSHIEIETSNSFERFASDFNRGILCLPASNFREFGKDVIMPDTYGFAKWIKKNHPEINVNVASTDLAADLRSIDFWLPVVHLASDVTLQLYLNLVANYVYDRIRGSLSNDRHKIHLEATYVDEHLGVKKQFTYDGSLDGFRVVLEQFDLNNVMMKE